MDDFENVVIIAKFLSIIRKQGGYIDKDNVEGFVDEYLPDIADDEREYFIEMIRKGCDKVESNI